jgi:hypothetical protein
MSHPRKTQKEGSSRRKGLSSKVGWLSRIQNGYSIQVNGNNLNNIKYEASRYFRDKTKAYLIDKVNGLTTNNNNKNARDLYKQLN